MGKFRILEYLLSAGADPSVCDSWGSSPLLEAIQHSGRGSLQAIIKHEPSLFIQDMDGSSVLHIVALYEDSKTMDILVQDKIHRRNPVKLDKNGIITKIC